MQTNFVQVECNLGKDYEVAYEVALNVDQIFEVYSTSGQFDLLIKCELPDYQDIRDFVTSLIQTLPGVADTLTTIALKAFT
jgi:DNA-binding Lrp family transcriptional regulator